MGAFFRGFTTLISGAVFTILKAIIVYIIGKWAINKILNVINGGKAFAKVEVTLKNYIVSCAKILLYVVLATAIVSIMGVPMTSIITVLASCGLAVGLALQGALSNLAGGIMLIAFKPFKRGDYIDAAGVSGTVVEVTFLYTVIRTTDNKQITVPNGSLMNANVTNYSSMDLRRVDLTFTCAKSENPEKIQEILMGEAVKDARVIQNDDSRKPFARISGNTERGVDYVVRVWVKNSDYWDVYHDLLQNTTTSLLKADVKSPAYRVIEDK